MAAKARKKSATHAQYVAAYKLVGATLASPNVPKAHAKIAAGFPAVASDFTENGRSWMQIDAPSKAAPKRAAKTAGAQG